MAMVASERRGYSVGVGEFADGFDPSNSSIPNPASNWDDFIRRLDRCGFSSAAINPTAAEIESVLQNCGPVILTHFCAGFPYGAGWAAMTSGVHAVVITGVDSSVNGGTCWMNNPWGNKDRAILTSAIVTALTQMQSSGIQMPVAYYQQ